MPFYLLLRHRLEREIVRVRAASEEEALERHEDGEILGVQCLDWPGREEMPDEVELADGPLDSEQEAQEMYEYLERTGL